MQNKATVEITVKNSKDGEVDELTFSDANRGKYHNGEEDKNEKTLREFKNQIINEIEEIHIEESDFSMGTISSMPGNPLEPVEQIPPLLYGWTIEINDDADPNEIINKIRNIYNKGYGG